MNIKWPTELRTEKSKELFDRAKRVMPRGITTGIPFWADQEYPLYFSKAKGSKLWDVDGNEYTDHLCGHGSILLGHAFPSVTRTVREILETGLLTGMESELTVKLAELIAKIIPCAERVKFVLNGSDAAELAVKIARAHTKRKKLVKMEGHYHGLYDYLLCNTQHGWFSGPETAPDFVPGSDGIIEEHVKQSIILVPWNNTEALEKVVKEHRGEIAGVIMEASYLGGTIPPREGYLKSAKEITTRYDVPLIFDEIITGFRSKPGGVQEYYGVTPDMAIFGKAMANGYPIAMLAGRRDLMETIHVPGSKIVAMKTFFGNLICLAAAWASVNELRDGHVQEQVNHLTERLVKGFNKIAEEVGTRARMQGIGGQFTILFGVDPSKEVTNIREARMTDDSKGTKFLKMQRELMKKGYWLRPSHLYHHGLTYSHTAEDIDGLLSGMRGSLLKMEEI